MDSASAPTRKTGFLLLSVVFLLGIVCGGALVFIIGRAIRVDPPGPHPVEFMARHLDLDEKQEAEIRAILDETREQIETISLTSRDRIREVLTPDQLEKFDELRSQFRRRPGRRHRRSGGQPPPGGAPPPPPD
ncbi:MAG: hypothetical protein R3344_11315 [Acidobacteriota bacterium]|nr:hypothetical protein [Acidobacteriota bacterium]